VPTSQARADESLMRRRLERAAGVPPHKGNSAAVCGDCHRERRGLAGAFCRDLAPIIKELQAAGKTSLRAIAAGLNDAGIPTARSGKWSSPQVMRMLERFDPFREEEAAA
jgi:Recombinase